MRCCTDDVAKVNYIKGRSIRKVSIARISVCAIFHKASDASKCKMSDCWLKPNPLEPFSVRVHTNIWFELENTYTLDSQSATAETGGELINLIANVHKGQIASSDVHRLFTPRTALEIKIAIFITIHFEDFFDIFVAISKHVRRAGPPRSKR